MQSIDDLFTLDRTVPAQDITIFPFYIMARKLIQKQTPTYGNLRQLKSWDSVTAEQLLRCIGAEKAHFRIYQSNAGLPIILPITEQGKAACFDFISVKNTADIPAALYDFTIGSRRGEKAVLDDLFLVDAYPLGFAIPLPNGLILPKMQAALAMHTENHCTTYRNAVQTKIKCYGTDHAITFRFYTQLDLSLSIMNLKLEYWLHNKDENMSYPLNYDVSLLSLDPFDAAAPHGEILIAQFAPQDYYFAGHFSECELDGYYTKKAVHKILANGYLEQEDGDPHALNIDKLIKYMLTVALQKHAFYPTEFAQCKHLVFV